MKKYASFKILIIVTLEPTMPITVVLVKWVTTAIKKMICASHLKMIIAKFKK